MECPRCGAGMQAATLDGHHGRTIVVDLCHPCQALWFDGHESPGLSPGSTLALFRLIGENVARAAAARDAPARCPRCRAGLQPVADMQGGTRFRYLRCPHGHGRLTAFVDFLREKNFLRPLTPEQIAGLRRHVQTVRCSGCGAPIDLARGAACGHCGAPLSMLDMPQAEALVARLRRAEAGAAPGVDPALPLALARARREAEQAFSTLRGDAAWWRDVARSGLVGAGLAAVARWLKT